MHRTEGDWPVDSWSKMTVAALQLFNSCTDPWYQQTAFIDRILQVETNKRFAVTHLIWTSYTSEIRKGCYESFAKVN